ncbi:hypothetical protein WJX72_012102 [[Myrmecia] bisecta]|uniref:Non-specific serine/threonine protein kinase n=1 Tax=[Myrmecia] bisecta TaxID=41462 RepID=A0AAW1PXY8_9CHLO
MLATADFQAHAQAFFVPETALDKKLALLIEIRDGMEIVHSADYLLFLKAFFGVFCQLLQNSQPQQSDNMEHRLRNLVLEILNRLPANEMLRPFANDLMKLALLVLQKDNEDNALICLRILFDLHKAYKGNLEEHVQPFMEFVRRVYDGFPATYQHYFEVQAAQPGKLPDFPPSLQSFKVVAETPIIVMYLYNLYHRRVAPYVQLVLGPMVAAIILPGPEPDAVPEKLRTAYSDLKQAQIKTLSFLTYLLRGLPHLVQPHQQAITDSLVRILKTCPDSVVLRKELLVDTRHMLTTTLRGFFYSKLEVLLEEEVLVGKSRVCQEALRPLAYSMLAELIHHVRGELTLPQLRRCIYIFSRNIHEPTLQVGVQCTSVRLMLNLVEVVYTRRSDLRNCEAYRQQLTGILDTFIAKFSTLRRQVPKLLAAAKVEQAKAEKRKAAMRAPPKGPALRERPVLHTETPSDKLKELHDTRQLLQTLVMGMKTLLFSITSYGNCTPPRPPPPGPPVALPLPTPSMGLREGEIRIACRAIRCGVPCLRLISESSDSTDIFDSFADMFTVLQDPRDVVEVFTMQMPLLFSSMLKDTKLIRVVAQLLSTQPTGRHFADVLLTFLVNHKLEKLQAPVSKEGTLLLKLFSLVFDAATKFPAMESVLLPLFPQIMENGLRLMTEAKDPSGYLKLLQTLFRALSVGKFGAIYEAFGTAGLLQNTLRTLRAMLDGPNVGDMRTTLLELCLIMPARLSDMLAVLSRLMQPLVAALKGPDELVALGLRTLEYWVDSLNPEFLEPAMAPVQQELMHALWAHLKPAPYHFGGKALQLLGKLGGRNRRFLKAPLELEYKDNPEHGLRLILTFQPSTSFLVPLDRCINLARGVLQHPAPTGAAAAAAAGNAVSDAHQRQQALRFLHVCLASVLSLRSPGDSALPGSALDKLAEMVFGDQPPPFIEASVGNVEVGTKTKTQLLAERQVLKTLIAVTIGAAADPAVAEMASPFARGICRHFALLFAAGASAPPPTMPISRSSPQSKGGRADSLKELDPHIFLDALVEAICDESTKRARAALDGLSVFVDSLKLLLEAQKAAVAEKLRKERKEAGQPADEGGQSAAEQPPQPSTSAADGQADKGSAETAAADAERQARSAPGNASTSGRPHLVLPSAGHNGLPKKPDVTGLEYAPVLDHLIPRVLHCCYGESWPVRIGGVAAISVLVRKLPAAALTASMTPIIRALMAVLKHLPEHASGERPKPPLDEALLESVVEVLARELLSPRSAANVRQAADACLQMIVGATGRPLATLAGPLMSKVLPPLDKLRLLPIRHLAGQMGNAQAVTVCVQQRPTLLPLSPELVLVVTDAFVILEMDEGTLLRDVQASRSLSHDSVTEMRRVCIELLAAAMAWEEFREREDLANLRNSIIQMFFQQLTSPSESIIATAKAGLAAVIAHQKMPKELLQSSLRPILVHLAFYNKLKLPLLKGLARLLELLANWFNVTLGDKLIQHLKKWLEPEKLLSVARAWEAGQEAPIAAQILDLFHLLPPQASKFLLSEGDRPGLVVLTIELELALGQMPGSQPPSKMWSPYRLPLTKFLNKYAAEAVVYFLAPIRLQNPPYFDRFLDILKSPEGRPLLDQLAKSEDALANVIAIPTPPQPAENGAPPPKPVHEDAQYFGVHLLAVMVKLLPDWLPPRLFAILQQRWASPQRTQRLEAEDSLPRPQLLESKRLAKAFLNHIGRHHDQIGPLFDLMSIFTHKTRVDYTFIKDFCTDVVAETFTHQEKHQVLMYFLEKFEAQSLAMEVQVHALHLLIIPMLDRSFGQGQNIVDDAALDIIVRTMFDPPDSLADTYADSLKMELLQLATLLIQKSRDQLQNHRKELIKFGWNHLKRDDSACKCVAFLNVSHFLDAYQAPEKIVLQVFVALLRTPQPDARRVLVRQALDVLTPALVRRVSLGDWKYPIWVRYTKKVLVEEGHSLQHLMHIWQLLVRHADLFYSSRMQFVPQMVNSLQRLGLPANSPLESRQLSIDLVSLIIRWETQRITSPPPPPGGPASGASRKRGREDSELPSEIKDDDTAEQALQQEQQGGGESQASQMQLARSGGGEEDAQLTQPTQDLIINFLMRLAFVLSDAKDKDAQLLHDMQRHTLELLSEAIALWPASQTRMAYLDKLLASQPPGLAAPPPAVITGLEIMNRLMEAQAHAFVLSSHPQIILLLEPCFTMKSAASVDLLCAVLTKVYKAFPIQGGQPAYKEAQMVQQKVHDLLGAFLTAAGNERPPGQHLPPPTLVGVCTSLRILETLAEVAPEYVQKFTAPLVKMINRLARDHAAPGGLVLSTPRIPLRVRDGEEKWQPEYGQVTWAVQHALRLAAPRVLYYAEHKNLFLRTLVLLITGNSARHVDAAILMEILLTVRNWLLDKDNPVATLTEKEAVLFLQRLAQLERTGATEGPIKEVWEDTFLDMIHTLVTSPTPPPGMAGGEGLARDALDKVERMFLLGLRAAKPAMRAKFFQLYNAAVPANLFDRLTYIVCGQDWEHLSSTFWLKQALDMLLAILIENEPIKLAPNSAQVQHLHISSNIMRSSRALSVQLGSLSGRQQHQQ